MVGETSHEADRVGEKRRCCWSGSSSRRTVESRVEKSRSSARTPASVRALSSVDLPALVYPTIDTSGISDLFRAFAGCPVLDLVALSSRSSLEIRCTIRRRSVSSLVSPGPRRAPRRPVARGSCPCLSAGAGSSGAGPTRPGSRPPSAWRAGRRCRGSGLRGRRRRTRRAFAGCVVALGSAGCRRPPRRCRAPWSVWPTRPPCPCPCKVAGSIRRRRTSSRSTGSAPAVSVSRASSSRLRSASTAVIPGSSTPTSKARWTLTSRSVTVAVRRRRLRAVWFVESLGCRLAESRMIAGPDPRSGGWIFRCSEVLASSPT